MKPLIFSLLLFSFFLQGCKEEGQPIMETFPKDTDVIGYWKLNRVYLDNEEVSFDNYRANLKNEYYRISTDKSVHYVTQLNITAYASNLSWTLDKDLLQISEPNGSFYKIQLFNSSQLVLSPNSRQNLKLEYKAISVAEFPETSFSAVVAGEAVNNTLATVEVFGSSLQVNGSTNSFFLALSIPLNAQAGQQYIRTETDYGFGALIVKNNVDYGNLQTGTMKIIAKTKDYIHVEFDFTVKQNNGEDKIVVNKGTLRAIIRN